MKSRSQPVLTGFEPVGAYALIHHMFRSIMTVLPQPQLQSQPRSGSAPPLLIYFDGQDKDFVIFM